MVRRLIEIFDEKQKQLKIAEEQFLLRGLAINGRGWGSYRMDRELTVHMEEVIATLRKKFSINHSKTWQMN